MRIYRDNDTKDEGTLWFERLTAKNVPHTPTTFMTLGQPVNQNASPKVKIKPSLHGSVLTLCDGHME